MALLYDKMKEKSKRVLILTTAFLPLTGGSEIAVFEITRRLPNIFFDIATAKIKKGLPEEEDRDHIKIRRFGWGSNFDKFLLPLFCFIKYRKLVADGHYNYIHAYQASFGGIGAWLLKLACPRVKFVLTLQEGKDLGNQTGLVRFFRRLINKRADLITAISQYLADYASTEGGPTPICVIPNGVDFEKFQIAVPEPKLKELRERLGLKGDERVVISISRLVEKNGLRYLLLAFKILRDELKRVKLLLVGEGPESKILTRLSSQLDLGNSVLFLGNIKHDNLPAYLQLADVFVRPSLSEGLGNAFLEAMAAGVPVIGTAVGGITDFLTDGQTGLLCLPRDPEDIAKKMNQLLADQVLAGRVKNRAANLAREKYNWEIIAKRFNSIYCGQ
jgi:glycosyltransferase involved in cell wall biosynthesis